MGLNTAGINALLNDGNEAAFYVAVGDGATAADQVSAARVLITWAAPSGSEIDATATPYGFTGTPDGAATHMLFFSAGTGGTFYGSEELDGDQVFNSDGEFQITAISFTAAGYDPGTPIVPDEPFALGSEVGVPTGTTLSDRSSLGSPTGSGTYTITNPVTDESEELTVMIWSGIRFTQTVTPAPGSGEKYLFQNCSFEGQGNWCVEIDGTNHVNDIMSPLVAFDHCSFDGGDATGKCLLGGYAWAVDCDMRGAEDGWSGWFYNVAIRSNFLGFGVNEEDHSDGVQCTDIGHSIFSQCWFSTAGPGASQAFRLGTEAGATSDVWVEYSGLDGGGWTMQSRGDSGAGDITAVTVLGCRWTRDHAFGPADFVETTDVTWTDNAYFDGEVIPSPV